MKFLKVKSKLINVDHIATISSDVVNTTGRSRVFFNAYKNLNEDISNKINIGKIDGIRNEQIVKEIQERFITELLEEFEKGNVVNVDKIIKELDK